VLQLRGIQVLGQEKIVSLSQGKTISSFKGDSKANRERETSTGSLEEISKLREKMKRKRKKRKSQFR